MHAGIVLHVNLRQASKLSLVPLKLSCPLYFYRVGIKHMSRRVVTLTTQPSTQPRGTNNTRLYKRIQ
jgi:hypothetical protein